MRCLIFVALAILSGFTIDSLRAEDAISTEDEHCHGEYLPAEYNFLTWGDESRGCYLSELNALDSYLKSEKDQDDIYDIRSRILEIRSMIGDDRFVLKTMKRQAPDLDPDILASLASPTVEIIDARSKILQIASTTNVVVINEAHYSPKHRAFVQGLLPGLADLGYRVFAAEALDSASSRIDRNGLAGPPLLSVGYYSRDPAFGNLIRTALQHGYRIFPYEPSGDEVASSSVEEAGEVARERLQASRIANLVNALRPGEKILVLAGFYHVMEFENSTSVPARRRMMASYLKGLIKQDILTIDQDGADITALTTRAEGECRRGVNFQGAPVVLNTDEGLASFGAYKDAVDVSIVHRCTGAKLGRFKWRWEVGELVPLYPKCRIRGRAARVLAQAFLLDDPESAVPIDQLLIDPKRPTPLLVPASEAVRIACVTGADNRR